MPPTFKSKLISKLHPEISRFLATSKSHNKDIKIKATKEQLNSLKNVGLNNDVQTFILKRTMYTSTSDLIFSWLFGSFKLNSF